MLTAASAAVSVLSLEFPKWTGLKPAFNAASLSSGEKSPSGPMRTATERAADAEISSTIPFLSP